MAEEKKKTEKKTEKNTDRWLTWSGIQKEAKRIRWPKLKSEGSNPGILQNTGEVLIFTGFFAAFFVCSDFIVALLMRLLGIGV